MSALDPFDRTDVVHRGDIARMAATLDVPAPEAVPPLWHWTSFLDRSPTATLGPDGHPREGGLIPAPPYPRRMFAGGRMRWDAPLPLDTPIRRTASVGEVVHKEGARGPLAFVTVELTYSVDGQQLAVEEQDLVYLPDAPPAPAASAASAAKPSRTGATDTANGEASEGPTPDLLSEVTFHETTLFRFSALTFNTHRIHYDLPYTRDVEGHPGLVVHGPMLVMRLLDVVRAAHGDDAIERLAFRAVAPTYAGATVRFSGWRTGSDVRLEASDGVRTLMKADVTLRPGIH
jgi:3-methylfumaryl-CoA hydratase